MRIPPVLLDKAGTFTRIGLRRQLQSFQESTKDCRATQRRVLRELLSLNSDSRFSQRNGITNLADPIDFRRRIPVTTYDFFGNDIDCLKRGDCQALLGTNNRLLMFALSSGTTSDSKFIPVTQKFLDDYRRGWQIWAIQVHGEFPVLARQRIVQLSSDHERYRTDGGIPCGNISGLAASVQRKAIRVLYTLPPIIAKIDDPEAKYYTALRLAVADPEVGMLMTANPSTILHQAKLADSEKETLIRDIRDGTLSNKYNVAADIRQALRRRYSRRDPRRATTLEQAANQRGRLLPDDYWPNLNVVAVWKSGSCSAYLEALRDYFPSVHFRDHGLSASEGRMTIPLNGEQPGGILDIDTHYFEFVPEDQYGSDNPDVLEAHELVPGECYYILLTTSSGLYRYDICDVVQCDGFFNTTPILNFLHKGAHISNITGEKLSESQVVDAVKDCLELLNLRLDQFTVMPSWGEPPQYQLMIENSDLPSQQVGQRLAENVDNRLQELNSEYREKRNSGRLAQLQEIPLPSGTWTQFARDRQSSLGGSIEQYKHPCLIPDLESSEQFVNRYANRPLEEEQ